MEKTAERLPLRLKIGIKIPQGHTSPGGMGILNQLKSLSNPFQSGRMCDFCFH